MTKKNKVFCLGQDGTCAERDEVSGEDECSVMPLPDAARIAREDAVVSAA